MNKKILKKLLGTAMLSSMLVYYTVPAFAYTNEETIYSKLDVNGKNYKTIVSQIEENEDGRKVSQVESEKDLPIEYEVTYKLDGEAISAEDVIGKKGRVTVSIKYINKDEKQVYINGSTQTMYTPFLVVSGVILENDNNKNIEINHGKVINNGEKSIVAGFAIPGLIKSLKLEDSDIDVCDTVEISMDTEKFEMGNIMTYATPKVFSSLNIKMSDFNSLFNKVTDLQNAGNKLVDGTAALNEGIIKLDEGVDTLKNGSDELDLGVYELQKGSQSLNSGAVSLKNGISEYSSKSKEFNKAVSKVSSGASELNTKYSELDSGINTLNSSSSKLEAGAKQIADGTKAVSSNLDKISGGLSDATSGSEKLSAGVAKAQAGVDKIAAGVKTQVDTASSSESKAKLKQMSDLITTNTNTINKLTNTNKTLNTQLKAVKDESTKATIQAQIDANKGMIELLKGNNAALQASLDTMKDTASKLGSLYEGLTELKTGMSALQEGTSNLENGLKTLDSGTSTLANETKKLVTGAGDLQTGTSQLKAGTNSLAEGSSKVAQGIGNLSNGTTQLSAASNKLTAATDTISSGANDLQNGTQSLLTGVNSLKQGTTTLSNGVVTLSDGSKALVQGSTELKDGMNKFKTEGIDKVVELVNVDGKNLIRRIEKLEELSESYNTFEDESKKREDVAFVSIMDGLDTNSDKNKDDKKE